MIIREASSLASIASFKTDKRAVRVQSKQKATERAKEKATNVHFMLHISAAAHIIMSFSNCTPRLKLDPVPKFIRHLAHRWLVVARRCDIVGL